MNAVLLLGFGLMAQAPCATVDQVDAGWALVRLPDGELDYLPFPAVSAAPIEGARVCASGLQLRPRRLRSRPAPLARAQVQEIFR